MTDTDMLYMASLEKRNSELEAKVAELEEKHWNECGQIAHYSDELRKAKELLKAAVEDLRWLTKWHDPCELCGLMDENGECPADLDKGIDCDDIYKWQHEIEALALIGEDTNVPATETDINVGGKGGNDNA